MTKHTEEQSPKDLQVKQEPQPKKPTILGRIGKVLRYVVLSLFVLILVIGLAVTSGVIYIRTESGQKLLVEQINAALVEPLKAQGLSGEVTSLSGDLPFEIKTGLKLADAKGQFLEAKQVHFDLGFNLWPMGLKISHLVITNPTFVRVPILLPSTEPKEPEKPSEPLNAASLKKLIADLSQVVWDLPDWLPYVEIADVGIRAANLGQELAGFPLTVTCILGADFKAKQENTPPQIGFALKEVTVQGDDLDLDLKVNWGSGKTQDDVLTGNLDVRLLAAVNLEAFLPKETKKSGATKVSDEDLAKGAKNNAKKPAKSNVNVSKTSVNVAQASPSKDTSAKPTSQEALLTHHDQGKKGKQKGLRLALNLTGPTLTPTLDLKLDLDRLVQAGQTIEGTNLLVLAKPLNLQGFLGLKTGLEELGLNLKLKTRLNGQAINLDLPVYSQMESNDYKILKAGVRKMALNGLGLNLGATLEALVGRTDLPLINGELQAKLTDWAYISAFVPDQNFAGQVEAKINLKATTQTKQQANVHVHIPSFALQPKGQPTLVSLDGLNLKSDLDDLFNKLNISADLAVSRVAAGPLNISTQASVKGSLDGEFKVVLATKGNVDTSVDLEYQKTRLFIRSLQVLADVGLLNLQAQANQGEIATNLAAAKPAKKSKKASQAKNNPKTKTNNTNNKTKKTTATGSKAQVKTIRSSSGRKIGLRLLSPAEINFGDQGLSIKQTQIALLPTGSLTARGQLAPGSLDLNCNLTGFDLGQWQTLIPALPAGKIDFKLDLGGSSKAPRGGFKLNVASLKVPKAPLDPLDLGVSGQLTGRSGLAVKLDLPKSTLSKIGLEQLNFNATVPLTFADNGVPNVNFKGALDAALEIKGKLARLWRMVPVADLRLIGDLDGRVRASGTLEAIKVAGNIKVDQGKFEDPINGVLLRNLALKVDLDGRLSGQGKPDGKIKIDGQFGDGMGGTFVVKGQTPLDASALNIAVKINKLKPLRRNDVRISLSGDVKVTGSATDPKVTGTIVVDNGALQLENVHGGAASVTTLPITTKEQAQSSQASKKTSTANNQGDKKQAASGGVGSINLAIKSPGRFLVDGYGLSTNWQIDLTIIGPLTNPVISGEISSVKGNLDFLNKNFKMEKGIVTLAGGNVANPLIDMLLTNTTADFTSHIRISGTVKKLKLSLSSEPEMPQDDILARILFGRNANELGGYEALQLAATVAKMASGFGTSLNNPRKALGVDVMRVKSGGGEKDSSDNTGMSSMALETGKYINESLYVGVEQGTKEGSTAGIIQLEITPRTKLEMRSQQTNTSGSLSWKYQY